MNTDLNVKSRRLAATRIMKCLRGFGVDFVRDKNMQVVFSITYSTLMPDNNEPQYIFSTHRTQIPDIIEHIISATISYLKYEIHIRKSIQNPPYYNDCVRMVEKMIQEKKNNDESPDKRLLNSIVNRQFDFQKQDAFTYFQVNGLIALCSKPDLCGFYSRGESLDIVQLFDLIRPILKQLNVSTYNAIYCIIQEHQYPLYRIFSICANTSNARVRCTIGD